MSEFGTTAWGRAWLRLAEPVTVTRPDPQLPRARSLARRDRVGDLELGPGRASATVDDESARHVTIEFPQWDDTARGAVGEVLAGAGPELPDEIVDRFAAAGAPLTPGPDEVHTACDCPAARRYGRCRHVLATLIEIARRADESQTVALTLRGAQRPTRPVDSTRIPIADLDHHRFWT